MHRWTSFTARSMDRKETWAFRRCPMSHTWELRSPDGYIRQLERTWEDSLIRLNQILANHGLTANIN